MPVLLSEAQALVVKQKKNKKKNTWTPLHLLRLPAPIKKGRKKIQPLVPEKKSNLLQVLKGATLPTSCLRGVCQRAEKEAFHGRIVFTQLYPGSLQSQGYLRTAKDSTARQDVGLPLSKGSLRLFSIHHAYLSDSTYGPRHYSENNMLLENFISWDI